MVKIKMSSSILKWTSSPVSKLSRSQSSSLTVHSSSGANANANVQSDQSAINSNRANATTNNNLNNSNHINNNLHHNTNTNNKRWIHEDSLLINGHVAYLVKFLGNVEVDQPKGLDVVKESIKKLEFQEHLKRSEGHKIKRVELTISIDGVAIRDPKSKVNIHQFPLHRISYCADDKSNRKFLSFITRVQENCDKHECFVFISDKLSEEITFTIGQAFEIAYKKYLDSSVNDFDTKKELLQARERIKELERKVNELEQKLEAKEKNSKSTGKDNKIKTDDTNGPVSFGSCIQPLATTTTLSNQTIDLSLATSKLQSLIDMP